MAAMVALGAVLTGVAVSDQVEAEGGGGNFDIKNYLNYIPELDVTMLGLLLLTIPVCSVLDALMEYRHASDPRRRSTVVSRLT